MLPRKNQPNSILKQLCHGSCQLFNKNGKAPFEINLLPLGGFSSIKKLILCDLFIEAPTA